MDFILENLGKIGFDWRMGLFNLFNFLVLFWILKRYFFKPILKIIHKREKMVQDSVDNIQKAKTELGMAQNQAQELIDHAKVDANRILERVTVEAKKQSETIKEKAKTEVELLVLQAKKNIEIDKKEMKAEIKKETAELVVAAVEKVIRKKLVVNQDKILIEEALLEVK
jgi:F-type H+-transporting ATPase subunit b